MACIRWQGEVVAKRVTLAVRLKEVTKSHVHGGH